MKTFDAIGGDGSILCSEVLQQHTILKPQETKIVVLGYNNGQVLVSQFYHKQANQNVLKYFTYKGKFDYRDAGVDYQRKVHTYRKNDSWS